MPHWFNKPKFHFLLHLPTHIQHFGPAVLFATEAFESFNAIIQTRSVHSNHLAPSQDIAIAFAHNNHICHLLSGRWHLFWDNNHSWKDLNAFKSVVNHGPVPLQAIFASPIMTHNPLVSVILGMTWKVLSDMQAPVFLTKVDHAPHRDGMTVPHTTFPTDLALQEKCVHGISKWWHLLYRQLGSLQVEWGWWHACTQVCPWDCQTPKPHYG